MATRRPLVAVSGGVREIASGDLVPDAIVAVAAPVGRFKRDDGSWASPTFNWSGGRVTFFDHFLNLYATGVGSSYPYWNTANTHCVMSWAKDDSVPSGLNGGNSGFLKVHSDTVSSRNGFHQVIESFETGAPFRTKNVIEFDTLMFLPNEALSDGTNDYTVRIGFSVHNTTYDQTPTHGCWFEYSHDINSGNWRFVTRNASSSTNIDSSVAAVAGGEYRLKFVRNAAANSIEAFINGTSIGTASSNVLGDDLRAGMFVFFDRAAGTARRCVWVDWWILEQLDTPSADGNPVAVHATSHQNGGADEISVAGLSGLLADGQTPLAHATSHKTGGSDSIKLDELAAPTDVTTLNATTSLHGLAPKATAPAAGLLSVLGIGNGETVRTDKALFDTTNPAALGTVAPGTQLVAARRDHVHANPAIDTLAAATDITTLNATTTAHGLVLKATAPASGIRNVVAIDNAETVYKNTALFDTTNPAALGTAAPGTSLIAARRDHVHQVIKRGIVFIIDGGGSTITTGLKGFLQIPFACTINGWTLIGDASGAIVVDIWKDTYANAPPTVADTITAAAKPTITASAQKNTSATLTGWTTAITAGDVLGFNVDSVTTFQRVTLQLEVTPT